MSEWETFCDTCYFDLWRVRRKDERGFNDGYHLQNEKEAKALIELLNRLEHERNFSRELHALAVESIFVWKERTEKAERERDEAMEQNAKLLEETITYWKERERIALNAASEHSESLSKLHRRAQRVEAQNAKLRDIADRAIIPLECDGVPWGAKLRAELDQIKEGAK